MKSPTLFVSTSLASLLALCTACGSSSDSKSNGGSSGLGGTSAGGTGGGAASGGTWTTGGVTGTGGLVTTTGGMSSGGMTSAGGGPTGGVTAVGGGGPNTGGTTSAGGASVTGGASAGGGTSVGGSTAVGGGTGTGGRSIGGRGGGTGVGGATGTTGGTTGGDTGGTTGTTGGTTGETGGGTGTGGGEPGAVTVQLAQTRQTIDGFGINNNWAPAMTDQVADALFDPDKGIGLSILRIGMGSDGNHFNSASPQDIQKAKARGAKYIIGSTWSPPGSWKTNNSENDGGHLKPEYYDQWSDRIASFAQSNSLYAMSPGNEPDFASCGMTEPCNGNYPTTLYTANEMVDFVKVLGPKLKAAGVKLLGPEASEWLHNWSNVSACCSDPGGKNSSDPLKCGCFTGKDATCAAACAQGDGYDYGHYLYADKAAWDALDIMGVHQYDTQVAEPWPDDVPEKKPVWQTEMSGVKWWPEQGPSTDINNGVAVAEWFHNALTVGEANAWLWWWYNGTSTNEGLVNNGTDTKRHYTFGNYTKFVRPGYVRVDITGNVPGNVLLSAYKGEDGTVVVVAINKGSAAAEVPITIAGGTAPASMTPNVTSASDNLAAKAAVTVTGGTFTASLGGTTVTTFVGK